MLTATNIKLFADTPKDIYEDVFLYAQNLEAGGAYEQAELEYKRYIFLQDYSEGIHQTEAFTALADLYKRNNQWELAAQTIQKAILSAQNDSFVQKTDNLRIEQIQFLENTADEKHTSLSENIYAFSYMNLSDFSDEVRQFAYLSAIENDINGNRIGYAEKNFNLFTETFPDFLTEEENKIISSNFENLNNFKPKKQFLAAYLSFIPGLGQLYAGNVKDSINAFLLNGSIIAISAYSLWTMDVWTFSLIEFSPLIHFMKGNIYNAQKDVYEYNQTKQKQYEKNILEVIETKKKSFFTLTY